MKRVMPWGKFAGQKISELETGYLKWICKWIAEQGEYEYYRFCELNESIEAELEGRRLEGEWKRIKAERKAKRKKTTLAAIDEQNRMAARIIAGNPRRYQGIMQEWAERVLSKPYMSVRDPHWKK